MLEQFVLRQTKSARAVLVPEIELRLAVDPQAIFAATDAYAHVGSRLPPYWAFAWPGGQAMARYILDHAADIRGRRVVDIGAGSGIASIAAALAGAENVLAVDIDPLAAAAVTINARANGVAIATSTRDILGDPSAGNLVLVADLVYEPELATRVAAFLQSAVQAGAEVLVGDRITARRPSLPMELVAEHLAPLTPPLPAHDFERARVWRLAGRKPRKGKP